MATLDAIFGALFTKIFVIYKSNYVLSEQLTLHSACPGQTIRGDVRDHSNFYPLVAAQFKNRTVTCRAQAPIKIIFSNI